MSLTKKSPSPILDKSRECSMSLGMMLLTWYYTYLHTIGKVFFVFHTPMVDIIFHTPLVDTLATLSTPFADILFISLCIVIPTLSNSLQDFQPFSLLSNVLFIMTAMIVLSLIHASHYDYYYN